MQNYKNEFKFNKFHPAHKNTPKGKRVALLMTGGLDSTYLYWLNIMRGNTVVPIYTNIKNNGLRSDVELHNVNAIISTVEQLTHIFSTKPILINEIHLNHTSDILFHQVPLHLLSVIMNVDQNMIDEIQIGYCMNDDIIGYIPNLIKIYKSYQCLFTVKLPKLSFPLVNMPKDNMLEELPHELKPLIFSCEQPIVTDTDLGTAQPCGYCTICKKYEKHDTYLLRDTRLAPVSVPQIRHGEVLGSKICDVMMDEIESETFEKQETYEH